MKSLSLKNLRDALRLTRAGQLMEATRQIQQLMRKDVAEAGTASGTDARAPITIDGTAERVGESQTHASPAGPAGRASDNSGTSMAEPFNGSGNSVWRHEARPAAGLPEGAEFVHRHFASAAGSRDYKLYIPRGYNGAALPLLVMLHGCTQSAEDFAAGTQMNTLAEEFGVLVAYPIQPKSANDSGCWNWFRPSDQRRDAGEPSLIAGITRQIANDYAVDSGRIYVAGLSAGGAAAAIMGAAYPELYAAVGVHSGLPVGAAKDAASAFAAMRQGVAVRRSVAEPSTGQYTPTIVFHGDRDTTVNPSNGRSIIEQMLSGAPPELRTVTRRGQTPAGRSFSRTCYLDRTDRAALEMWVVHGGGHAWSGGSKAGTYTDPTGPDASREMMQFFLQHRCSAEGDR